MVNAIGISLLCLPIVGMLCLGCFVLLGSVFLAFAKSRKAWIGSALLLPHVFSKLLDRIYDACIAGQVLDAVLYALPLLIVLKVLDLLLRHAPDRFE